MKRFSFLTSLFIAFSMFFLVSCGSNETASSDQTSDTATATPTETTPVSTVVTTPQKMMIARHKVKDYEAWIASYDAHDSIRLANGIHSYVIARGSTDPNMVLVAVKVDDMDKAKAFAKDASLKKAMQKGGVTGTPVFQFVNVVWQDTATISADLRSISTFTVKDWDAWQKGFEEGKQERIDNGIAVRSVGHDVDDNHKVRLVTALIDTAKAFAYWKSDALKKRREANGVIGVPERFVFRVAKRY
jgi:hypothetical protein